MATSSVACLAAACALLVTGCDASSAESDAAIDARADTRVEEAGAGDPDAAIDAARDDAHALDGSRPGDASAPIDAACAADTSCAVVVRATPSIAPMPIFAPPVPRPESISSTFGPRWKTSADRYDFHPGIDWFDAEGTPVTAIGDGTVAGVYPDGSTQYPNGGNVVAVRHVLPAPFVFHGQTVDRVFAVYMHLASFAVGEGDSVTRGQTVGAMGRTGDTTFVHLHFEIRVQTLCSLPYQTANPEASCVTGFDPHVHPFLFVGGRDDDTITLEEIAPTPGDAWAARYRATRGDLDLDVIETDRGTIGFVERRGLDATSLDRLDDFRYGWVTLVPAPFGSRDDVLEVELHFPVRPAFLEVRDLDGSGLRLGERPAR
ncbi:MAG: M23 family metallopeptidase [Deltaproteobacteria bacterium]|nr:M23 family metallopeptidase [Deltaproteobacteria bacterium]